jgi:uncharacterized protein
MLNSLGNISKFLTRIRRWAATQNSVHGAALIGSYARNEAKTDSDIDIMILTTQAKQFISNTQWASSFGRVNSISIEHYGVVTSIRVFYVDLYEVEFSFCSPQWAHVPLDKGTETVLLGGVTILYDPHNLFKEAVQSLG